MNALVNTRAVIALFFLFFSMLSTVSKVFAANPKAIFDILSYKEMMEVDLTFDLNAVLENRYDDKAHPGVMSFLDEQGRRQDWVVNVSLRGKFRRKHCQETPPLKIDFNKKDLKEAGLAPFDDLKLVTYCMDDDLRAKEALIKEYLIYKLYNQLTEKSYRVQLVKIKFKDVNTGETKTQLSFLIEDTAQLRARIDAEKIDSLRIIHKERFHPYYLKTVALFQYMIGNKDWGLTFSKNVKYLDKEGMVIPVPYDFDFAALVEASYTAPKNNTDQPFVHGREYRGFREELDALQPVIDEFLAKREAIINTIMNCKLLKSSSRKEMIAYLNFFFENPNNIQFSNGPI